MTMKKQSPIQIIFTDVDWTILNHGHGKHVYDMKSIRALRKAQKKGVKVFIATARPYHSLKLTGFFDIFKPDGMILANGAVVFDGNKIIYHDFMKPQLVKKICEVAKKHDIVIQFVNEYDRWISQPVNEVAQHYFDYFFEKIPAIRGYNGENISGLLLFSTAELDEQIKKEINEPDLDLFRLFDYAIDIRHHTIVKSDGIKIVLDHLGLKPENALALGDDVQDIAMFEYCGYSAAMENGKDAAKAKSKFVTKHIDAHGVKKALQYFKVI